MKLEEVGLQSSDGHSQGGPKVSLCKLQPVLSPLIYPESDSPVRYRIISPSPPLAAIPLPLTPSYISPSKLSGSPHAKLGVMGITAELLHPSQIHLRGTSMERFIMHFRSVEQKFECHNVAKKSWIAHSSIVLKPPRRCLKTI